ncbi:MAG: pyridoxamine 5'-phosphate oxidase [Hyphomicrobiales bacterium]|nr:pyridoxamine 5'-phosphate oxidase [Hyphomicrobiales bacterium]
MTDNGDNGTPELTSDDLSDNLEHVVNPFTLFRRWFNRAHKSEPEDPDAMALATVDDTGLPDVRMVLLKGYNEAGFVFYTNLKSCKGVELAANPKAALCLHWKSLRRQVRIRGAVEPVSDAEADAYFQSRDRMSRIGAWASRQSQPLESRFALEKAVAAQTARFAAGPIPRPDFWSGYRVVPETIEFWREAAFRLHDRVLYRREPAGNWSRTRLFP